MGMFTITIRGYGDHGCDRHSLEGEKLRVKCNRFTCLPCLAFDFVQHLRQKGFRLGDATFTYNDGAVDPEKVIVDDLIEDKRKSGRF